MMSWQCYLVTSMGYELVQDNFPTRFNRDDVTRSFEGRYGLKVIQVNPSPIGQNQFQNCILPHSDAPTRAMKIMTGMIAPLEMI